VKIYTAIVWQIVLKQDTLNHGCSRSYSLVTIITIKLLLGATESEHCVFSKIEEHKWSLRSGRHFNAPLPQIIHQIRVYKCVNSRASINKGPAVAEMSDRWATIAMGQKLGAVPLLGGGLGPHVTQCCLGRGLPSYQVAS